jgi:branched-chain amino acid transport system permease protein
VPLAGVILLILYPLFSGGNAYWLNQLSQIAILALVVSGVNLSFGYAGELQFSQVFMFALGAYVSGIVAVHGFAEIIPLLALGGAAAMLAGVIVAVPALRIGGWSLAMASFFLVITTPDIIQIFARYTGGVNGLIGIPNAALAGTALGSQGLYEVTIAAAVLWFACYRNLVTSRYGTLFRILRESPVQASSLGYAPSRLKLLAYALGALPAGMAGVLFGFVSEFIQPSSFDLTLAIGVVAASVLGGIESVYGAVVGAAILQLGPQGSLSFQTYAPVVYGLFLVVAAIVFRRGLGGIARDAARRASRALAGGRDPVPVGARIQDAAAAARSAVLREHPGKPLAVRGISKAFGGVAALSDVTISALPGEVTAIIGSNGSGKTTLLNVICGYARADSGSVEFGEQRLSGRAPHQIATSGVGRTFQSPSVPRGVSTLEVVASGRFHVERCGVVASVLRLPRYWAVRRRDRREALASLELVGLAEVAGQEASQLSLGTRRLVEVARAMCAQPAAILLDEPASGLSSAEVDRLGTVLRGMADRGTTVVLIEHNFEFITTVADTAHVLHAGRLIASGPARTIGEDRAVTESYLGSSKPRMPGRADRLPASGGAQ